MPLTRPLAESVVVVTGASSGIGATTALLLARHGTSVVLTARDEASLARVAAACERRGGRATWVAGDIAEDGMARRVAARATDEFGRLDAWINNAAVAEFCALADVPPADMCRVIEVDVLGALAGMQAAAPILLAGGGGVIVNVTSVLARTTVPWMGPYNASKHALEGLTATFRQELRAVDAQSVSVCTLLPTTVDTPLFGHAANITGHPARPLPPAYRPAKAARVLVRLLRRPRRRAYVGAAGRLTVASQTLLPGPTERILTTYGTKMGLDLLRHQPATAGNLRRTLGPRPHSNRES